MDLKTSLLTAVVVGIAAAFLLFFFPNQLFAIAVAGIGGFLLFNEVRRPLKQRDRQIMGFGMAVLLASGLVFTGLLTPFVITNVGITENTNIFDIPFDDGQSKNVQAKNIYDSGENLWHCQKTIDGVLTDKIDTKCLNYGVSAFETNLIEELEKGNSIIVTLDGSYSANTPSSGRGLSGIALFNGNTFDTDVYSVERGVEIKTGFTRADTYYCTSTIRTNLGKETCGMGEGVEPSTACCKGNGVTSDVLKITPTGVLLNGEKKATIETANILGEKRWFVNGIMVSELYVGHYWTATTRYTNDKSSVSANSDSKMVVSIETSAVQPPTSEPVDDGVSDGGTTEPDELEVSYTTEFVTNLVMLIAVVLVGGLLVGIGFKKYVKRRR